MTAQQTSYQQLPKADAMADLMPGEGPSKCTWTGKPNQGVSPHARHNLEPPPKIMDSILDQIGNTPLVRLHTIPKSMGIECEMLAKCEYFNAGGSVKDRIGKRMVLDAEKSGRIKKGDVLIEPTSGNTGIGMSLAAALRGYRMIITLPEKMSQEKVDVLKALGAEIVRTPTEAAFDAPESHIGVAKQLNKDIPNSHILDQYKNPSNPLAHYDGTAEEILYQCDGKIDVMVASAGTGGTITGIARKLKERVPNVKIVGVDPIGSILALPESLNVPGPSYHVEGIGYDFIPTVLNRSLVDEWVKTTDKEAFLMSRRLIREEGLLVGGSAGATMTAALKVAKTLKKGDRLVVLFSDSVRNYMSKFLNDGWMQDEGFIEPKDAGNNEWWSQHPLNSLKLATPLTVAPSISCENCVAIMRESGYDQLPVVDTDSKIMGVVALGNVSAQILSGKVKGSDPISKVLYKQFKQVDINTPLSALSKIFDRDHFALVVTSQRCYTSEKEVTHKRVIFGVVTRMDLLSYIVDGEKAKSGTKAKL